MKHFGCLTFDVSAAEDLPEQSGLMPLVAVGIHRASVVRVRVSLQDPARDLDHGPPLGE